MWHDSTHPLWKWLLRATALANAAALLAGSYLPFTDLPQHAATMAVLRHWADPSWRCQELYQLALGQTQYLLYYAAGAALTFLVGTAERANLLLLCLIGASFPYALRSLLRALERDERLALFAAPLFFSQSLLIGFFNYLAAVPVVLLSLSLAVRQAKAPSRRGALLLALSAVLLFYLHLSALVFFLPAALFCTLWIGGAGPPWRRLSWLAPVAGLSGHWLFTSSVMRPGRTGWTAPVRPNFHGLLASLLALPQALTDIWHGWADQAVLLVLLAAGLLIAAGSLRGERQAGPAGRSRGLGAVLALYAALLYFAMPYSVGWLFVLNERYAVLAALLLPLSLVPARGLKGALPLLLVASAGLFAALHSAHRIRQFQEEAAGFDRLIEKMQPGRRLLSVAAEEDSTSGVAKFLPFHHFGAYYRARKGGTVEPSFLELPQSPIRYQPEAAPPRKPENWEWSREEYPDWRDEAFFDYLLVRRVGGERQLSQRWELIGREGGWSLFERR